MGDTQRYKEAIKWVHVNTATTSINRSGQAKLHRVTVNLAFASTADVYNSPTGAGDKVATIDTNAIGTLEYGGVILPLGLTVVTSGTADLTVVYE